MAYVFTCFGFWAPSIFPLSPTNICIYIYIYTFFQGVHQQPSRWVDPGRGGAARPEVAQQLAAQALSPRRPHRLSEG